MQVGAIFDRDMQNLLMGCAVLIQLVEAAQTTGNDVTFPYKDGHFNVPNAELEQFKQGLFITTNRLLELLEGEERNGSSNENSPAGG